MALRTRESRAFQNRLRVVKGIFLAFALLLAWRSGQFLIPGVRLRWQQQAEKDFYRKQPLPAERGRIYDRYGKPLALNRPTLDIYQKDTLDTLPAALRALGLKPKPFKDKAIRLKARADYRLLPVVLKTPGLYALSSWSRWYPAGPATSSLLGMVGDDQQGLDGVELKFDPLLRGKPGYEYFFYSSSGRKRLFLVTYGPSQHPERGQDLYLTVDRDLTELTYLALRHGVDSTRANWGFAVVMDPHTGDVLAMVTYPSPDPAQGVASATNRTINTPYEPGSVFKVLVYSLAFSRHLITPETKVDTRPGWMRVGRYRISDVHAHGGRVMTYAEALIHSSNVAAAKLALQIPAEDLYRWARAFGIGQKTGIGLPGESPGILRPPHRWGDAERADFAIGHGVSVTGLQMALVYSAIANGGLLLKPRIQYTGTSTPEVVRRVLRPGVADTLKHLLYRVVEEGTGRRARIPGLAVAGKTGTAIKVDPKTGRYNRNKVIVSFVGFFPVDHPRYVINVVVDEPRIGKYGGDVAAPIFKHIARGILALDALRSGVAYHQGLSHETVATP